MKSVYTFTKNGSALKGFYSMSMTESGVLAYRQETDLTISGNAITMTSRLADGQQSVVELTAVTVSGDDLRFTAKTTLSKDGQVTATYGPRQEHFTQWVEEETTYNEYFADGPLFCFRWQKPGQEGRHENWEIVSCTGSEMVNKALHRRTDGSTYTITAHLKKVE